MMPWLAALGGFVGGTCGILARPLHAGGLLNHCGKYAARFSVAHRHRDVRAHHVRRRDDHSHHASDHRAARQTPAGALRSRDIERQNLDRRRRPFGCGARRFGKAAARRRGRAGKVHQRPPNLVARSSAFHPTSGNRPMAATPGQSHVRQHMSPHLDAESKSPHTAYRLTFMRRIQFIELHEQTWFPAFLRDDITDTLQYALNLSRAYASRCPAAPRRACLHRESLDCGPVFRRRWTLAGSWSAS